VFDEIGQEPQFDSASRVEPVIRRSPSLVDFREQLQATVGPRYVIERELGGGGMSRTFVAEERELGRKVVLKVLPPEFYVAFSLERFQREIRLAARMQHPHIVPILAAGEAGGWFYYTMPFVPGESLRRRLAHEHQLSVDEAVRLTCDVAEALAHAHAQGIVHRDVKPDNILLSGGHALLTDFGIAKAFTQSGGDALTATGVSVGTPQYMAPEQASGMNDVGTRADIYALGCVIYELLAGKPPFTGANAQAIVAQHFAAPFPEVRHSRPDIAPAIDAVIRRATAKAPADRYATATDFSDALRRAATGSTSSWIARHRRAAVGAAGVLVLVGAAAAYGLRRQPALTERDTILIADFVNTTGDTVFDGTLKQALAVQLQQTPFLNLFPEEGVAETLKLMERAPTERVTRQIGREICQRHALKAMILGTIAGLGSTYVITLEAVSAQTGEVIASQQSEAATKEQVLAALQQSATALRRKLGESLGTIQKYNAPIEQATTSSLGALSFYSKGLEQIYSGKSREALPLFNRAVELDSNFASAYNWLSWTYANLGNNIEAARFAERAFALRDRVTERERFHIAGAYQIWATAEWDKAYDVEQQAMRLYPTDWLPHNNLAIGYHMIGQDEKAAAEAREGMRANPNEVHVYWHLSNALIRLNQFDDARNAIVQGRAHNLDHPWYRVNLYVIASAKNDSAAQRDALAAIRERDGERTALLWQARAETFAGRWRAAQLLYGRSVGLATASPSAAEPPIELLLRPALFGFCRANAGAATQILATAHIDSPRHILYVPVGPDGALCGEVVATERAADEQAKRYPNAIPVSVFSVPLIRAAIALKRGQPEMAIEALKGTRSYEAAGFFWPNYLRGQAHLKLKQGAEAAVEFQTIIDHRGWDPLSPFYPLAYVGLARASALVGQVERSRKAYQDFFALWEHADADLPVLVEVKTECAALPAAPSSRSMR
jgi:eukaryotic-like serine/threonine-protein kinase